ncbi:MAG: hypothetical protein EXR60_00135 [Dehalococcoidia bacterium]|nr:hypothetical protein [Dehalococcoidia bacterium]
MALPRKLAEEVKELAPPELHYSFNRLVVTALHEFVERQRARAFAESVARMAKDPAIQAECAAIARDFAGAEADGLK